MKYKIQIFIVITFLLPTMTMAKDVSPNIHAGGCPEVRPCPDRNSDTRAYSQNRSLNADSQTGDIRRRYGTGYKAGVNETGHGTGANGREYEAAPNAAEE